MSTRSRAKKAAVAVPASTETEDAIALLKMRAHHAEVALEAAAQARRESEKDMNELITDLKAENRRVRQELAEFEDALRELRRECCRKHEAKDATLAEVQEAIGRLVSSSAQHKLSWQTNSGDDLASRVAAHKAQRTRSESMVDELSSVVSSSVAPTELTSGAPTKHGRAKFGRAVILSCVRAPC